jgi:hypothetical protein
MPKIIAYNAETTLIPSKPVDINNCLVLTGGGTNQTFFSCGAVACLVDNGLFDFQVISAVSGGTLLLTLIDLCTSPLFDYWKQPDWYNRYVRKNVYNFTECQVAATFFKNGFDPQKLSDYIFEQLSDFNKKFDQENNNVICEYNYVDSNRKQVTCDHTDIIDLKNKVEYPFWWILRPLRCTLPLTNFNSKPTYDAGVIANIPVNSIFTRYNPKNMIIIQASPIMDYDTYPELTIPEIAIGALSNIMWAANNSSQDMLDLNIRNCDTVIYCSMSNSFAPSQDKYHNGLFSDWEQDVRQIVRFYNGAIYNDNTLMRIIENEGYIQMYYQLKKAYPKKKLVFKIPNPEVYNANVKEMVRESISKNVAFEFIKEIVKAPVLP